jgi:type IV pilus assembly protein PilC
LENFQKIKAKVKGAMTYPVTMLVFALGAVAILLVKVIPTFVGLFAGHQLPAITQLMLNLSAYLQTNWRWMLALIIGVVVIYNLLYTYFLPFKILIDGAMLKIPGIKWVVKTFYLYRLSKLLADFYKAWVNPVVALEQIAAIFDNYHYRKKMLDVRTDLEAWFGFGESMNGSDLFDPILVQIVLVGEKTGNIDDVLQKMAVFYNDSLDNQIKSMMSLIEPILMAFIACIVGGIVASIFLPMADLVNVIWW